MPPLLKYSLVALVAFLVGFFLGGQYSLVGNDLKLERRSEDTQRTGSSMIEQSKSAGQFAFASAVKEHNSIPTPSHSTEGALIRSYLLGELKESGGYVSFDLLDADGQISDAFSRLYGLTQSEREALNREARMALNEYFQMALANSDVRHHEDGSVEVSVAPFEGAEDLYSSLLDQFQSLLGKDRFTDFLEVGDRFLRDEFNQFGGEKLRVTIAIDDQNGTRSDPRYKATESRERMGQNTSRTLNNLTEKKLDDEFRLVRKLIERSPKP